MSPCFARSVLMVLGVVAFFNVISAVAEVIAGYQRYHKNRLRLSHLGFKHIDRDGTGLINQTEFQAREHARAHTHTYTRNCCFHVEHVVLCLQFPGRSDMQSTVTISVLLPLGLGVHAAARAGDTRPAATS